MFLLIDKTQLNSNLELVCKWSCSRVALITSLDFVDIIKMYNSKFTLSRIQKRGSRFCFYRSSWNIRNVRIFAVSLIRSYTVVTCNIGYIFCLTQSFKTKIDIYYNVSFPILNAFPGILNDFPGWLYPSLFKINKT